MIADWVRCPDCKALHPPRLDGDLRCYEVNCASFDYTKWSEARQRFIRLCPRCGRPTLTRRGLTRKGERVYRCPKCRFRTQITPDPERLHGEEM